MDLGEAEAWIDGRLAAKGERRTGPVELVRSRPWGEVARVGSTRGPVWLKAPAGATAFEVPLYGFLAEASPEAILPPLGIDADRGWVLLPDGGPPLAERKEGAARLNGLIAALRRYARFQRDLEEHSERLLGMGLADMRPTAILERFDQALEFAGAYADGQGSAKDSESLERIKAHRDVVSGWAGELSELPGQPNLDHNDLHPWNILGDPERPESIRFYDWGDSVVAHPFASAALPLGMIEREDPGLLQHARDAYLEAFADWASNDELVRTLELACRCAKVARAHTWERAMRLAGDDADPDFARAPLESLESLLDETYTSRT